MLLFSSGTFTVDGITVFPDHADSNQFWYLPGPVGLEKQAGSNEPQFLLIEYAPEVGANGIKGVGFLNLTTALTLSDITQHRIMGQIRTQFPNAESPRLAPVPFDDGTVQVMALDMQGSGGTFAKPAATGIFEAVQTILGTSNPELFGNNDALFALTLSEDGATILKQAFEDGMTPVGVIYSMKFTGACPAIDVKITADLKRAYDSFSVGLTAKAYFVSASIDATFEKLRQDGVIKVEVTNLNTDATNADKENWALSLFKDQIMSTWFQPSLSPTSAQIASIPLPSLPGGAQGSSGSTTGTLPANPTSTGTTAQPTRPPQAATAAAGMSAPATTSGMTSASGTARSATAATASAPATTSSPAASAPTAIAPTPLSTQTPGAPATTLSAITPTTLGKPATPSTNPIAGAVGTAANASSAASPFGIALQLKYVSQDELKTVEIEYNRMSAVQRIYAPQGYFGLLLNGIDRSKHFLQIDGTDPFFNQFSVTVNPPKDFTEIGLLSAHAAMDYGDASDPNRKHGETLFDPSHTTTQQWDVFEGSIQRTDYTYRADYKFDPDGGWEGESTDYTMPTVTTESRVLNLDPFDFVGFLQIVVSPGRIDWTTVDHVDVSLQYNAAGGWQTSKLIQLRSGSPKQFWNLRIADKSARQYSYATTCYFKDGSVFPSSTISTVSSAVIVNDPFVAFLNLTFQPAFDATAIKLAVVEVSYRDDANNYNFNNTFEIPNTTITPTTIRIPLMDATRNRYQYRISTVDATGQSHQSAYVASCDPVVLVTAVQ